MVDSDSEKIRREMLCKILESRSSITNMQPIQPNTPVIEDSLGVIYQSSRVIENGPIDDLLGLRDHTEQRTDSLDLGYIDTTNWYVGEADTVQKYCVTFKDGHSQEYRTLDEARAHLKTGDRLYIAEVKITLKEEM